MPRRTKISHGQSRQAASSAFAERVENSLARSLFILVALVLGCSTLNANAFPDCSAPAAPGVDWSRCFLEEANFTDTDLSGAALIDTRFQRADLSNSIFDNADAQGAKFVSAILISASFKNANLREADMTKANLEQADFSNANLRRTRFFRANLRGANFTGAHFAQTDLLNADVTGATWTDGIRICAEGSIGRCK